MFKKNLFAYVIFCKFQHAFLVLFFLTFYGFSYNGTSAKNYAGEYCDGFNSADDGTCSDYLIFSNDCANFVSQCLIAGGLTLSGYNADENCGCIVGADDLDSYLSTVAPNHYYFHYKGNSVPGEIDVGDVIIYYGNSTHAAIVTSVNSKTGTGVKLSAHTQPYCNDITLDGMFGSSFTYCDIFTFGQAVPVAGASINISGPSQLVCPVTNATYNCQFYCPSGQICPVPTQWNWRLTFNHSGGNYLVATAQLYTNANGFPPWNVPAFSLPTSGYNWIYNNGQIIGEVSLSTPDGYSTLERVYYSIPYDVNFSNQTISNSQPEIDAHDGITIFNDQITNTGGINFKAGNYIYIDPETQILPGSSVNLIVDSSLQ